MPERLCRSRLPDGDEALHSCGQAADHEPPHRCRGCERTWIEPTPERSHARDVTLDRTTFDRLVAVATYASRGRRFVDVEPYPDATARAALGSLCEDGLLP